MLIKLDPESAASFNVKDPRTGRTWIFRGGEAQDVPFSLGMYLYKLTNIKFIVVEGGKTDLFVFTAYEGLGDFIHSTVIIKVLRNKYPNCRFDLYYQRDWGKSLGEWKSFRQIKHIDRLFDQADQFGGIIAGRHCYTNTSHFINNYFWNVPNRDDKNQVPQEPIYISNLKFMEKMGFEVDDDILPFWELQEDKNDKAEQILKNFERPIIGIHNSKSDLFWFRRKWPIEKWKKLTEDKKYTWLQFGSNNDWGGVTLPNAKRLDTTKDTQLMASLISKCNCFVGCETGPTILAQSLKVPTILLAGPTGDIAHINAHIIENKVCKHQPCYYECSHDENVIKFCMGKRNKTPCMDSISEEVVNNTIKGILR